MDCWWKADHVDDTNAAHSHRDLLGYTLLSFQSKQTQVQMYDYGNAKANLAHYNTTQPPVYDLTKFNTKAVLFIGDDDKMADPIDANNTLTLINRSGAVLQQIHVPR